MDVRRNEEVKEEKDLNVIKERYLNIVTSLKDAA